MCTFIILKRHVCYEILLLIIILFYSKFFNEMFQAKIFDN